MNLTLLDRLAAVGDQVITSMSNLLLTLMLARVYPPVCLAGFAIGTSLALLLQGIYRSSFVLPASLFHIGIFRSRAARLAGQHTVLMAGTMALAAVAATVTAVVDTTSLGVHAAAASLTCILLFVPIDFDRMMLLRLGFRKLPLGVASGYLVLLCGLFLLVTHVALSFFWLMAILGCFCLGRMMLYAGLLVRPDFRSVGTLLRINMRRNVHWGVLNNVAAGGYFSAPVLLLGWSAPALNVAAYNAMRNLSQPLQLLLRSFDIIDKLLFTLMDRSDAKKQRSHILFILCLYASLSAVFTAAIAVVGGPLSRLAFGARYDGFVDTLVLWGVVTGLTSCLAPLETVVYSSGKLKAYALTQVVAGACALAVAYPLIQHFSDFGAVAATLLGTGIAFLGLLGICAPFLGLRRPSWSGWPPFRSGHRRTLGVATGRAVRATAARLSPLISKDSPTAASVAGSEPELPKGRQMVDNSIRRTRQSPPSFVGQEPSPVVPRDDAARFFDAIRRHWKSIVALALALPVAVVALTFVFPFRYTAWSEISIDPRGQKTTESDIVPSGYGNDVAISDSQIRIITSDAVLMPVVRDLHLTEDPEFGPSLGAQISARLAHAFGRSAPAPDDPALDALRILRQRVTAKRVERTYIIDIGVSSSSAERAALLTQAVTKSYMADHERAEGETIRSVATFLSSRLDDLRTALIGAEKRVEDYKELHNLLTVNDVEVTEQQLSDLNTQLASASAREAQAQARLDAINRVRADKGDPGSFAAALDSPVINELRKQAAEASRSEGMMAATLGPRHPALYEAHQQTVRIKALIADELRRISQSAAGDLAVARGDEAALKRKIAALQVATVTNNRSMVGLRELQREVEARRGTYQAFLSRSQSAGEQENAAVTNLRLISPATAPDRRDGPGRPVLILVALIMGALIGIGQAIVRDRLNDRFAFGRRFGRGADAGTLHDGEAYPVR